MIGVVDTNCDPDEVDYVIPGNDDALRSIRLFAAGIADAVLAGRGIADAASAGDAGLATPSRARKRRRRGLAASFDGRSSQPDSSTSPSAASLLRLLTSIYCPKESSYGSVEIPATLVKKLRDRPAPA